MKEIRLCKDCKRRDKKDNSCSRTSVVDYVNGEHRSFSCQTERQWSTADSCGPEARFFEPIVPKMPEIARKGSA